MLHICHNYSTVRLINLSEPHTHEDTDKGNKPPDKRDESKEEHYVSTSATFASHKTTNELNDQTYNKATNSEKEIDGGATPELPDRRYLEDKNFVRKLDAEMFPEVMLSDHKHLVDDCMLPELPERRYLEDTDFELQISPEIPERYYSEEELNRPKETTLSIEKTTCKKIKADQDAGKTQSQERHLNYSPKHSNAGVSRLNEDGHSQLQELYMKVGASTRGPAKGARKEYTHHTQTQHNPQDLHKVVPPSEGQYMSLCEATKDKHEAYQNSKEDQYMSLSESTRERGRFTPWGQGHNPFSA